MTSHIISRVGSLGLIAACAFPDFDALTRGDPDAGLGGFAATDGFPGTGGAAGSAGMGGVGGEAGFGGTSTGGVGGTRGIPPDLTTDNLVPDPSFEARADAWVAWNEHDVQRTQVRPCSGNWCLVSRGRTQAWMGPALNMLSLVTPGVAYQATLWARASSVSNELSLTLKVLCREPTDTTSPSTFTNVGSFSGSDSWQELVGVFIAPTCSPPNELQDVKLIIEGPDPGVDVYVDDVKLTPIVIE